MCAIDPQPSGDPDVHRGKVNRYPEQLSLPQSAGKTAFSGSQKRKIFAPAARAMNDVLHDTANTSVAYCIEHIVLCSPEGWPAAGIMYYTYYIIFRIILYYVLFHPGSDSQSQTHWDSKYI